MINSRTTEVEHSEADQEKTCPLHKTRLSLNACRVFKSKSIEERWTFIKDHRLCFRCFESDQHVKRTCKEEIKYTDCGSSTDATALQSASIESEGFFVAHCEEPEASGPVAVNSSCPQICVDGFNGKSCVNTYLYAYVEKGICKMQKTYAIAVIYLQFYIYVSQDSLGLYKVSPTRKSLPPLQNFP